MFRIIDPFTALDMRLIQKSFLALSLGILLLIPLDLLGLSLKAKGKNSGAEVSQQVSPFLSKSFEPLSSYESGFQKSSLFGLSNPEAPLQAIASSIAELTKDYRLKGVVILDTPEALIEDARTQATTFVKEGDKIGELTVKEVKTGAVILSYYGEEKELRIV